MTLSTGSVLNGNIDGGGGAGQIALVGSGTIASNISNFGAGSALSIAKGATWTASGSWTIASVSNSGTFTPGTTSTPLKLTGNFVQTSTGTFVGVLNANGTANELQVTGTASLAGAVVVTEPASVTSPIKYTILTASGGVTGTFASFTGGTALLPATLSYDADDVFVTVQQEALTTLPNATPNELAAGAGFDAAAKANPVLFGPALGGLDTLQTPQLAANLDRLTGENNADLSTTAIIAGRQFINQFQNHALLARTIDRGLNFWGSGFAQSGYVGGDGNSHRMNEGGAGGAGGAELGVMPGFAIGAMLGYGSSRFDVVGDLGSGRINFTEFAATADYVEGPLYMTGLIGGMEGNGSTLRDASVPGISTTAAGKPDDSEVLGAFEMGYQILADAPIHLIPFAGINLGSVNQDAFSETGGGPLDLATAAHTTSSAQTEFGLRMLGDFSMGDLPMPASVKAAWGHDFADTARIANMSFTGGSSFLIDGAAEPADSGIVGLGLSAAVSGNGAIYLHYDGDLGSHAESQAVTAGIASIGRVKTKRPRRWPIKESVGGVVRVRFCSFFRTNMEA